MKKKLFTLLTLLLCVCSGAWALDSGTESSGNQGTDKTNISGISYTLDGKFIAGKGGVKQGNMPDKGVKLRSNQSNLVFEVADGYKITGFKFWGCGNTTTAVTIVSATVDGRSNLLGGNVLLPGKGADESGDINLTSIEAEDNITLTFEEGSTAQIVGTWKIDYVQTAVIVKEITGATLNGSALSDEDLATLKSTKSLTIDGTSLNGSGIFSVTLSSGTTTVNRTNSGTSVIYSFSVDEDDYTVTVTNIGKTYTAEGSLVYYSKNGSDVDGANSKSLTVNGINFVYPSKTFQYGTGSLTIGSDTYKPIKLSTGEAVNVTFPTGKVATKVIIYGWSVNGNGWIDHINESSTADKKISTKSNIFYATNTEKDIFPSVYEYDLDDWESFYFTAGGSASQPFVIMDFVLVDAMPATVSGTITACGFNTYSSNYPLDLSNISGGTAYVATSVTDGKVVLEKCVGKVPSATGMMIAGNAGATFTIGTTAETTTAPAGNMFVGMPNGGTVTAAGEGHNYVFGWVDASNPGFYKVASDPAELGINKAYLHTSEVLGTTDARLALSFEDNETTGINNVNVNHNDDWYDMQGRRVMAPQKGLYIVNGRKVVIK